MYDKIQFVYDAFPPVWPDAKVVLIELRGRYWITEEELKQEGYNVNDLDSESILWLNHKWFEIVGYSTRAKAFWLERINVDEEFLDLPMLGDDG